MPLWKESTSKEQFGNGLQEAPFPSEVRKGQPERTESLISSGLTIEGKIQGVGHVRIAGRFKGDVEVEGDLTLEAGAEVSGDIRAKSIVLGGEVHGTIQAASRVEVLETGTLIGELKAGSVSVRSGARMRGKVDFGWDEEQSESLDARDGNGASLRE